MQGELPRDVRNRAGFVALWPALIGTGYLISTGENELNLVALVVGAFLFWILWGLSFGAALLIGLFGRWIEPEGHMQHASHCDVCQARQVPLDA